MVWIAAGLGVALVVQGILALLAFYRQGVGHQVQVHRLLEVITHVGNAAAAERSQLLTRIQHPEVRVFPPSEQVPSEPPRDAGELAFVGQIVPDGYHIGEPLEPPDQNP